jgi:transcriptional regulator with XRE-family HTH domain
MEKDFGTRLAECRRDAELTQDELGTAAGVSGAAVSAWEVGRTQPSMSQLAAITEKLHVSADYLLHGAANDSEKARA